MIISLNWLREYVNVSLSLDELVHRLTMVGLEVEGVRELHPFLKNVIVGRVETVAPHPAADRLKLCQVSDGTRLLPVVCGAPNVEAGQNVPLALVGAQLAGGVILQETKIRGQLSQGMICSQSELALGDDAGGIWVLPQDLRPGVPLGQALELDDTIIEVSITPNRGDCLSIVGIAREVAAICAARVNYPVVDLEETGPDVSTLASVTIDDAVGCPRYAARVVQNIQVGPSPQWLRKKIEAVGLRSINAIVDVTNFILMELGQPLHAFDYEKVRQKRIVVRRAEEGERFRTLDGNERTLHDDTLLICDGEGPVAIAGIMGGLDSEITETTRHVLIESAYFQPLSIRRTGKKIGLRSESSYRFERGVDPEGVIRALDRAAQLMAELGGGTIARGRIDVYPNPVTVPEIRLRVARTNAFLGTTLNSSEIIDVLSRIEMKIEQENDEVLKVVPPSFRSDITREVDLMEEVARLVGYDRVPVTYPRVELMGAELDPHMRARQETRSTLQAAGFFEVINYAFISLDSLRKLGFSQEDPRLNPIVVKNPLSEDQGVMRTTLIPGLIQSALHNLGHRNENLRIFELSKVFLPRAGEVLPHEPHHVAGLMAGRRNPHLLYGDDEEVDFADVKGAAEIVLEPFNLVDLRFASEDLPPYLHPWESAVIRCGNDRVGALGRLHPRVAEAFDFKRPIFVFELDFDRLFDARRERSLFVPLPRFPSIARDMALVLDESVPAREPLDFIAEMREPLIEQIDIFDIYKSSQLGEGKKSVAYRLVYRAPDRSLTDEEVNRIHSALVARVLSKFHATLR